MLHVILAVLAAMVSVAAVGFIAVLLLVKRSAVDRTIAELDRAGVDSERKDELGVFGRFFNDSGRTKLERKLVMAGWYKLTARTFLMRNVIATAGGIVAGA